MRSWSPSGTYWQIGQLCFLFISTLQALRQTLWFHMQTHIRMWLLCPLSVCWHLTSDISFVECESANRTHTMRILPLTQEPEVIFQHSGKRDASSYIMVPAELNIFFCTCEWWWVWEGFAVASYDSSSLGYLCDCDNVSSLHITFKYGDYYWNSLDL